MAKKSMTKIHFFPIIVEPLDEGGFLAVCSVLQGCRAEGETYAKAIENIEDVIKVHLEARQAHGEIMPEVSVPPKTKLQLTFPLPVAV